MKSTHFFPTRPARTPSSVAGFCTVPAVLAMLLMGTPLSAAERAQQLKNYWRMEGNTLSFNTEALSMRAEAPRGWISMKVGDDEFLYTGEDHGGMLFRRGDEWVTYWPNVNNTSHDRMLGRLGATADGVFLLRVGTGWTVPRFEVYAGFNAKEGHDLVVLLNDDIAAVRHEDPSQGGGLTLCRRNTLPPGPDKPVKEEKGLFVVHESGRALGVEGPVTVERASLPDGTQRLALVFPCKGFAANSFEFIAFPEPRASRLVVFPKMDVSVENGTEAQYTAESKITHTLNFGWLGEDPIDAHAEVDFQHSLGKQGCYTKKDLTEDQRNGRNYSVSLHPEPKLPGVSEAWTRLIADDGEVIHVQRHRVMFDWRSFEPEYNTPQDMKAFWDATLKELRETPLDATVERVYEDHPEWKLFHVTYNGWKGRRIHACMYIHKDAETPLPVMIGTHPSSAGFGLKKTKKGVYGSKIKADKRFITFKPLIRGHEPDANNIPFNHPWWGPIVKRDDYVARSWYCALVRGMDFLESRPDLADMDRVVARGGSQGGGLALVTAALDDRVDACLADSPSNCMLHYTVDPTCYGSFGPTAGQAPEGWALQDLKDMLAYYDPANMAPWIQCPTVIGVTTGDLTVHSMGGLGVYHNLTGLSDDEKWFLPSQYISHYHANSKRGGKKMAEFMDKLAKP